MCACTTGQHLRSASAYISIRQHQSQQTSAYVSMCVLCLHYRATLEVCVSIRQLPLHPYVIFTYILTHTHTHTHYTCLHTLYIYVERERERERVHTRAGRTSRSPPSPTRPSPLPPPPPPSPPAPPLSGALSGASKIVWSGGREEDAVFAKLSLSPPPPPPPPTPLPPSIWMKASGLRLDEGDFAGPENGEFGSTFARFLYVCVPV